MLFRPVRWDYFYDVIGQSVISLVRKLIHLRHQHSEFRNGEHYFFDTLRSKDTEILDSTSDLA
ncbi:MAG: hypothetical protein WBV73_06040 [Phormidium sp.]